MRGVLPATVGMRRSKLGALACWMAVVVGVGGCGASPPRSTRSEQTEWAGPLEDAVPGDAFALVLVRPAELQAQPPLRAVMSALLPDASLERYRAHTGIDIRTLSAVVWADTPDGSMWLVRGSFSAPLAVAEMGMRMLPLEAASESPFVRRAGHYQGARRDLVAAAPSTLLAVTGTPSLTSWILRRIEASAARSASGATSASDGSPAVVATASTAAMPASSLLSAHPAAVQLLFPRPLALPTDTPVGALLAGERAMLVAVTASGPACLRLVVELRGSFPPGASANFRRLFSSLAATDLGSALGLSDALESLSVEASEATVVLQVDLLVARLLEGLRMVFELEIDELAGFGGGARVEAGGR